MTELTKAEEQVMQILWKLEKGFVKDILAEIPEPKPAYNTVSTIVRILESKGFAGHTAYGKSHLYHPKVTKEAYRAYTVNKVVSGYFEGSPARMVSYFLKEKNLSTRNLDEILKMINTENPPKDQAT